MSELQIQGLSVSAGDTHVLEDISFGLKSGEVHMLMGPNGSGKTTLLNALMGHPTYAITKGSLMLDGVDITTLPTEKKARAGIFLSLQHLPEIPGVTLTNFLYRAHKSIKGGDMTPLDFYKHMEASARELGIDPTFLKKHLNTGLSGGEKKQSEVLQLVALEPKFALLDEIDSGVDIDALKKVFSAVHTLQKKGVGFLLVTHYTKILEHITPDHVHIMRGGKLVASGGSELIARVEKEGFDAIA